MTDASSRPSVPPLPPGLPVPVDDGAADHLVGRLLPGITLESSDGGELDLGELATQRLVLYVFPKMGRPDRADPAGWDDIPGARGCTQQSCSFRDRQDRFAERGYTVVGLSAQPTEEQQEAAHRLHLPFPLVADPERVLGDALELPTFTTAGMTLYRRVTLVARESRVVKVFYPVFPPDENAQEVLEWIDSSEGQNI